MIVGICGIEFLAGALAEFQPDALVCIFSPKRRYLPDFDGHRLALMCHDIEQRRPGCINPSIHHGQALQDFITTHRPARLLVQCRAGLGRAPAFALHAAMVVVDGVTAREQVARLAAVAPGVIPNRLVLRVADHLLGLDREGLTECRDVALPAGPRAMYGAVGPATPLAWWDAGPRLTPSLSAGQGAAP